MVVHTILPTIKSTQCIITVHTCAGASFSISRRPSIKGSLVRFLAVSQALKECLLASELNLCLIVILRLVERLPDYSQSPDSICRDWFLVETFCKLDELLIPADASSPISYTQSLQTKLIRAVTLLYMQKERESFFGRRISSSSSSFYRDHYLFRLSQRTSLRADLPTVTSSGGTCIARSPKQRLIDGRKEEWNMLCLHRRPTRKGGGCYVYTAGQLNRVVC